MAERAVSWLPEGWSAEENKMFEVLLAEHFGAQDRFQRIAAKLPGKDIDAVRLRFKQLADDMKNMDAGCVAQPPYARDVDESTSKPKNGKNDQERRKGVPWTEDEHRLFLLGLSKFGKGDWRSISRNYVVSRTPTQVASHAQKYFIRLNSMNKKDKRRSSIHDITSVNGTPDASAGHPAGAVMGQPQPMHAQLHAPAHIMTAPGTIMATMGPPRPGVMYVQQAPMQMQ